MLSTNEELHVAVDRVKRSFQYAQSFHESCGINDTINWADTFQKMGGKLNIYPKSMKGEIPLLERDENKFIVNLPAEERIRQDALSAVASSFLLIHYGYSDVNIKKWQLLTHLYESEILEKFTAIQQLKYADFAVIISIYQKKFQEVALECYYDKKFLADYFHVSIFTIDKYLHLQSVSHGDFTYWANQ